MITGASSKLGTSAARAVRAAWSDDWDHIIDADFNHQPVGGCRTKVRPGSAVYAVTRTAVWVASEGL